MGNPWEIYDALIDAIPEEVTLTTVNVGAQWTRVINSAGGIGMAWTMNVKSRPDIFPGVTLDGAPLREAAQLVRSWNLAESSIGQAAINSWHSTPEVAEANGFVPTGEGITWGMVFDPYATDVTGKKVAVIGHFPFAQKALDMAGEYICLERNPQPGDYPDSACEYLLPECDYVFISGSAFVNKTAPRLIELSRNAYTVLVGPSVPLNPVLFSYGVDTITGFVSPHPQQLDRALAGVNMKGMFAAGHRVHQHRPTA